MKIEMTVIIAFDGVPKDADLNKLTVEGLKGVKLMNGEVEVRGAKYIGHETEDVITEDDFVI